MARKTVRDMMDAKKAAIERNNSNRDHYVERIREAMVTSSTEMSRGAYIEALETIATDIEGMLEAAREEQKADEEAE